MKKINGFLLYFLMAGIYFVSVCYSISYGAEPAVFLSPSLSITASSNGYVCTGSDLTLSSTVSGGSTPYTYLWSGPNSFSSTKANPTIAGSTTAASGTYFVTVTDHVSVTATASTSVTVSDCHVTMSLQNCSQPAPNIIQFDLYAMSDGAPGSDLRANSFQYGINFNTGILQSGATTSLSYTSGSSDLIPPLNGFTFTASLFPDHLKILQNPYQGANTGSTMALNHQYKVGRFRLTSSSNFISGTSPNFDLQSFVDAGKYTCAAVVWAGNSGQTNTISDNGVGNSQRTVYVDCSLTLNTCGYTASVTSTPVSQCNGSNGTATASTSGGFTPFHYIWNNGQTTSTATGLTPGSYFVTITDAINCSSSGSVTVTQPSALSISCNGSNVSCSPGHDGTVSVTATGGGTPYSYLWSNGQTISSISSLSAGTYTVTVTDAGGCTQTCSFAIRACNHLTLSLQNCLQTAPNILQFDLYAVSDGSFESDLRANSFQYGINFNTGILQSGASIVPSYVNGTSDLIPPLNGFTFPSTTFPDHIRIVQSVFSGPNTGTTMAVGHQYKVGTFLLTSSSDWVNSSSPGLTLQTTTVTNKTNTGGLVWVESATVASNFFTTGTGNGQRSVSVSCSTTLNTCTVSASATATPDACLGGSNGTATVSASGGWTPYSYLWSNGQTTSTITGLIAGSYSVTVTDAISCTATTSATVTQPTALSASSSVVSNVSCNSGSNGSVSIAGAGGTLPYSGTGIFTGLTVGIHTFIVTDANGCTATTTATVTQPSAISASSSVLSNVSCNGGSNGSTSVSASGGTSPYNGTGTFSGLTAGTYTYTVTDAHGCTANTIIIITEPLPLSVSCSGANVSCTTGHDGTVSVTASGGTPAYVYSWSNGGSTSSMSGLSAGIYSVTVSDAHGCLASCSFTVKPCNHITLSLQNCVQATTNVLQIDLYVVSDGSFESDLRANSFQYGINFNTGILQSGAAIVPSYVNGTSDLIPPLNGFTFPSTTFPDHIRIVQSVFSGSNTGTKMIVGHQYKVGTFLLTSSSNWVNNSNPNLALQSTTVTNKTNTGGLVWIDSATVATNFFTTGTGNGQRSVSVSCGITLNTCTVTSSAGATPVACFGGSNGTATVSASGGWTPYTYLWSNGQTASAITGLTAGSYSVTVTDAISCTATASATITQPPAALSMGACSHTDVSCFGGSNGTASAGTVSNNVGTIHYLWSNGQTTATATGLVAGTYTLTVSDNCFSVTCSQTVSQPPAALSMGACSHTDVSCFGGSNGTASAGTVSNNVGTIHYLWSNGQTTPTATGLTAGTYTLTVSDNCFSVTCSQTVSQPPAALSMGACSHTDVSCFGGSNGTASAGTVSNNVGTIHYLWSNGQTTPTATGLTAGTYTLTVSDNCFSVTCSQTVSQPPAALSMGACSHTDVSCFGGSNGTASAGTVSNNVGTIHYLWSNGQTTATATGLVAGTYTLTVSDNCFSVTCSQTVSQPPAALSMGTCSHTDVSCFGGSNGTASAGTVSNNVGTIHYLWSNGQTTATATGLVAGTYTLTVSDNCFSVTCSQTVSQPPAALSMGTCSHTDVSCFGGSNGTASAGTISNNVGTANYLWSNGQTTATATGLTAGTYTLTVSDNCFALTCSQTVSQPPAALSMSGCSHSDVSCFGGSNGTASAGTISNNVGTVHYLWSNGQTTATTTGLSIGSYAVTVSDNCFSVTCSQTISQPSALTVSCSGTDVSCSNGSDGSVSVTASGGSPTYSYLWSNGATTASVSNVGAGAYTVTVTDSHGCTATCSNTVNACNHLTMSLQNVTQSTCNTLQFDLYVISDGSPTSDLRANAFQYGINFNTSILQSGASITPSYVSGSSDFISPPLNGFFFPVSGSADHIRIVENPYIGSNTGTTMTVGHLYNVGTFVLTSTSKWAANSNPGFTLQASAAGGKTVCAAVVWDGNATLPISISATGTGNDQRSVISSSSIVLNPCNLSATATVTNVACNGGSNGSATVSTSGGCNPTFSYHWNNGQTTSTATGLTAGSYSVTVTDDLACNTTASVTITQPGLPLNASCSGTNITCHGAGNGSASVVASGGTPSYNYSWSNGATVSSIIGLNAGGYAVTVTDSHGCTATCGYTVTEPTALSAGCSGTNVACYGGSNGSASVAALGGSPGYNYAWSNGATASSISGLTSATYSVTVTDTHGCTASCSYTVTQPGAPLTVSCSGTNASCNIGNDGLASVTASGGTTPYAYSWSNGSASSSLTNLTAGVYSVTVTDAHGCTNSCSYTIVACNHLTMSLQNVTQLTCNTLQFDLYVTSDGSPGSDLRANAFQYGVNFNTSILQSGVTVTPSYLSGSSDFIPGLNGFFFPASGSPDHIRIVENPYIGSNTSTTMTLGLPYKVGTFVLTSTVKWTINSNPGLTLQASIAGGKTVCAAVVWDGNATLPITISATGTGNDLRSVISSGSVTLNPCNLSATISPTNISCNGGSNGSATVSVSGGCSPSLTYSWSNGQTTQTATDLSAGSYSVTVTGDVVCTATASVTITQPDQLSVLCSGTNASCNGGSDGSASVSTFGGTPSYSYTWSNGATSSEISGLTAAIYTVTVTDNHGCTATCSYTVTENPCPFTTLNLKAFLKGPYIGSSTMRTTLYDLFISPDSTASDTITVNLWALDHLSNPSPDYSAKAILHNHGDATVIFPAAVTGNSWYIAVKHRNSIETWSHNTVSFSSITSYNFSDAMSKAYDNGLNMPMKHIGPVFLFYSGDIMNDGTVDVSDMSILDNDASAFLFGYITSDCDGDGNSDAADMALVDNNSQLLLFFARPY